MIPQLMHLRCEALSWGVESDPNCVPAQTHHIERVINFTLPQEVLVAKLAGRRVCDTCGRNYNVAAIDNGARQQSSRLCTCVTLTSLSRAPPPAALAGDIQMPPLLPKPDDCDICEGNPPLSQRPDDTEDVVLNRYVLRGLPPPRLGVTVAT